MTDLYRWAVSQLWKHLPVFIAQPFAPAFACQVAFADMCKELLRSLRLRPNSLSSWRKLPVSKDCKLRYTHDTSSQAWLDILAGSWTRLLKCSRCCLTLSHKGKYTQGCTSIVDFKWSWRRSRSQLKEGFWDEVQNAYCKATCCCYHQDSQVWGLLDNVSGAWFWIVECRLGLVHQTCAIVWKGGKLQDMARLK